MHRNAQTSQLYVSLRIEHRDLSVFQMSTQQRDWSTFTNRFCEFVAPLIHNLNPVQTDGTELWVDRWPKVIFNFYAKTRVRLT